MRVVDILLVEDDSLDAQDIRRTLDKMKILYQLHLAKNGEQAVAFLSARSEAGSRLPDVVLIDINMPKMNGLELLQMIRSTEQWQHLKCFVITTSEESEDRETAQALGVSGYIVKPFKLNNPSSRDSFNLIIDLMNL